MKYYAIIGIFILALVSCSNPSMSNEIDEQATTTISNVSSIFDEPTATSSPFVSDELDEQATNEDINEEQTQNEGNGKGLCEGELVGAKYDVIVKNSSIIVDLIWRPEFMPFDMSVGPDKRIFSVPQAGEEIYELKTDGSVEVAFQCPGVQMARVAAATDGAIWFTTRGDCSLIRVDPSGEISLIYQNGNCNIEPGPDGTVYAMDNGIVKVYPDGSQKQITDQVQDERSFAVSPNGDVVVGTYDGRIVKVGVSGEISELISGLCLEPEVFFNATSELYVNNCGVI